MSWRVMALCEWGPHVQTFALSQDAAEEYGAEVVAAYGWLVWIETAEWRMV